MQTDQQFKAFFKEKVKLEKAYMIVWMNAIVFKVRQESKAIDKAVHIAVGLNNRG